MELVESNAGERSQAQVGAKNQWYEQERCIARLTAKQKELIADSPSEHRKSGGVPYSLCIFSSRILIPSYGMSPYQLLIRWIRYFSHLILSCFSHLAREEPTKASIASKWEKPKQISTVAIRFQVGEYRIRNKTYANWILPFFFIEKRGDICQ